MKKSCGIALIATIAFCLLCACLARETVKVNENPAKKSHSLTAGGGNGTSYDSAVVLTGGNNLSAAVEGEYDFLSKLFGEKDKDWKVSEQTTVTENNKNYNMLQVEIFKTNEKHFYYFDVTWYTKKAKRQKEDNADTTK